MKTCLVLCLFSALLAAQVSSLDGDVVRQDGQPVANARVELRALTNTPVVFRTTTDASGHFRFTGLQAGSHHLSVDRAGFLRMWRPVSIRAGESISAVKVTLTEQGVISGKVGDAGGWPAGNARVEALRYDSREGARELRQVSWAFADDLGEYRLARLPAGQFHVRAHPDGRLVGWDDRNARAFYPAAYDISEAKLVTVEAGGETAGIDITLARVEGVRIAGRVVGPSGTAIALPGAMRVTLGSGNPGTTGSFSSRMAWIARDGSFTMFRVPPGTYTLRAGTETPSYYGEVGPSELAARQTVVLADRDVLGIELTLRPVVFDVRGRFVFEGKTQPSPMTIVLSGTNGRRFRAGTDSDGTFVIKGVVAGSYQVLPSNPVAKNNAAYVKSIRFGGKEVSHYLDLDGASAGQLELTMSSARARVEGIVSDAMGRPASGAWVAFLGKQSRFQPADDSGRFSATHIVPGDYVVVAMSDPDVLRSIADPESFKARGDARSVTLAEGINPPLTLVLAAP